MQTLQKLPRLHMTTSAIFLTVIDDFTHFCQVILLSRKSEVSECLKNYVNASEAFLERKVCKIRCDNGGEFTGKELKQWCKSKGITLDFTIPYSPQLNGTAERMIRTIMEKARSLLFDSKLGDEMWGEALLTSAF